MRTMPDYNKRTFEKLKAETRELWRKYLSCEARAFEAQAILMLERDEAREAARWLYKAWSRSEDEPVPPEEYEGTVEERWPWLLSQQ